MHRAKIYLVALMTVLGLAAFVPSPAGAQVPGGVVTTSTVTTTDAACVSALKASGATAQQIKDGCTITSTTGLGAETAPTLADLQAMASSGDAYTSSSSYPRYCRNWSQTDTTASWQEKHTGRFCYDHVNAYIDYWGGYHRCDQGWTIGWDLTVKTCAENRVNDSSFQGGYYRQNWDYYKVCLISKYLPVCFSYNMHVNVFPSGNVTYHKG